MTIDKELIQKLFDAYFECERVYINAENEQDYFTKNNPKPPYPPSFYTLDEYEKREQARQEWYATNTAHTERVAKTRYDLQYVATQLIAILPHGVWFKADDMAIGVTDANNPQVCIYEWAESLPSLRAGEIP